jgi:cyclopropane-fatty-acyl-phospholipid synthase
MHAPASWIDRSLLGMLRRLAGPAPVRFALGESVEATPADTPPLPVIRLADRGTLLRLIMNPEVAFGDGYAAGRVAVEGPLLDTVQALYESRRPQTWLTALVSRWLAWVQDNTPQRSRENIRWHYDLPTDFYKLWLDEQLLYTCAYFPTPEASLEAAQIAKMDHVAKKLWLRPGETVVEAGCGWGALALHMVKHYGVKVKAFNLSHEQIAYAREWAKRRGLSAQLEFIEDDYRNIRGRFDAFVSVGMLEHVGKKHYAELMQVVRRAIGDTGRGLLHFIGRDRPRPLSVWIRKRIFPGAYPPALSEVLPHLQPHDFAVLDIENLRLHYAQTLRHWLERYEKSFPKVQERFGSEFARGWRLYLAGSVAGFALGTLQLFQVVFAGKDCQNIPWTRAHLYESGQQRDNTWLRATS